LTEIRPYEPRDAGPGAELVGSAFPQPNAITGTTIRHYVESSPPRSQLGVWVTYDGDDLMGWADAALRWSVAEEGLTELWVAVRDDRRGEGLGRELYARAEDHVLALGAREIRTFALADDPASIAFTQRRGYREARREYSWALDLETADHAAPAVPDGVRIVRLEELRGRDRELFELYDEAHSDMPGDHPHVLEFDEWRAETLENPELDFEASSVVLLEGRLASFAWITSDRTGGGGSHELTGTLRAYRGRGLARLAKQATIHWAAETGLRFLVTSNDGTNAPMLALNERLGYASRTTIIELTKKLDRGEPGP
jgi:GNAT superfamily N-acetyltransferase